MTKNSTDNNAAKTEIPTCGIVMPISTIDGCDERHWKDVLEIISKAATDAGYESNLVSNDAEVGVIHKRIVQNLYTNPIVIVDVSAKNPNVMFELGMRLAFDKPVVIIKDDKTPYSFDTAPVEHLTYPRDLRFQLILEFQRRLTEKIKTVSNNSNSFLNSFGTFKVAKIKEEAVDGSELILDELTSIKRDLRRMETRFRYGREPNQTLALFGQDDLASCEVDVSGPIEARRRFRIRVISMPYRLLQVNAGETKDTIVFKAPKGTPPDAIFEELNKLADDVEFEVLRMGP